MPYITVMQTRKTHQLTFDDVLMGLEPKFNFNPYGKPGSTITFNVHTDTTMYNHLRTINLNRLLNALDKFNREHEALFAVERHTLYRTFKIPKRTGGYRTINAPEPELMEALRVLKSILERDFNVLYHTSAFAYIKGRCTVDSIKKHQGNRSKWFLKTDFSDFFGSTSEDFLMHMLSMIFPFSEIMRTEHGASELRRAMSLCFLDGGLPQGTPLSPLLTNLIMIPIDHELCNRLIKDHFVYTRYADDILISSKKDFKLNEVCDVIREILARFGAPYQIKPEKTRYGSSAGRNWNLGVMLNKDNDITIGRKKKERLKAACTNYIRDKANRVQWSLSDVQTLVGNISYYKMVEPDYVEEFIKWFNEKHHVNLMHMLREELR